MFGIWNLLLSLSPIVIPTAVLYFEFVGLFGNANIIIATIRKEQLRTKHGILLALTSFYQSMCLLFELANVAFSIKGGIITRNTCFLFMAPYLVFSCLQSTMYLVLAVDILCAIVFPLWHMSKKLSTYIVVASLPAIFYAVVVVSKGVCHILSERNDPVIILCNPPLALGIEVRKFWVNFNGFSNLFVVTIYISAYAIIHRRDNRQQKLGKRVKNSAERKAATSLLWLIAVFACTWCTCMVTLTIVGMLEHTTEVAVVESYVVIFALMAYSVNYYVYFIKNHAYRRAFLEQLEFILPKRFFVGVWWTETRKQWSSNQPIITRRSSPSVLCAEPTQQA